MDLLTYDPPLPWLPLLGRPEIAPPGPGAPSVDWAAYLIRLARALAGEGADGPRDRETPAPPASSP